MYLIRIDDSWLFHKILIKGCRQEPKSTFHIMSSYANITLLIPVLNRQRVDKSHIKPLTYIAPEELL